MIDKKHYKKLSKSLSLVLRHRPEKIGIELDSNGWTSVKKLIDKMNTFSEKIDFETLEAVIETNDKKRFSFNEDKTLIRANQGHSINIDLGYEPKKPPTILFHGTADKSVESILKTGIEKRNRQHVHLSKDRETAIKVGQRHGNPIILEIHSLKMSENGYEFYLSDNNVWLTEFVPVEYIERDENNG